MNFGMQIVRGLLATGGAVAFMSGNRFTCDDFDRLFATGKEFLDQKTQKRGLTPFLAPVVVEFDEAATAVAAGVDRRARDPKGRLA